MLRTSRAGILLAAIAVATVLAGCTAATTTGSPKPSKSSPAPSAQALGCADLASGADLAAALGGTATPADPTTVALASSTDVTYATAVAAAGGLQCAWLGPAQDGFTPTLTVELLPDPQKQWTAMLFGDGPSNETRTFGSHTVTAASGDPGYGASGRVGGTWAFIVRTFPPTGTPDPQAFDKLDPAFTSVLDAAAAKGSRLSLSEPSTGAGGCDQLLSVDRMSTALGGPATYQVVDVPAADRGIGEVAQARVSDIRCFGMGATQGLEFAVAHGGAPLLTKVRNGFDTVDLGAFTPTTLTGLAAGDWAIALPCGVRPGVCEVIFTHNGDVIQVTQAPDPIAVAEAIIAQNL